jgi:hypothetical protein
MKNAIRNIILVLGVSSLIFPAGATVYKDAKLRDAIERPSGQISIDSDLTEIENYLIDGAEINASGEQEALILRVATILAEDAQAMIESEKKMKLSGKNWIMYGIALPVYIVTIANKNSWFHVYRGATPELGEVIFNDIFTTLSLGQLLSGAGRAVLVGNELRLRGKHVFNIRAKTEILKMLLKHPAIDLSVKNKEGKTALDLVQESMSTISAHYATQRRLNKEIFRFTQESIKEVEALLQKKQEELGLEGV